MWNENLFGILDLLDFALFARWPDFSLCLNTTTTYTAAVMHFCIGSTLHLHNYDTIPQLLPVAQGTGYAFMPGGL